MAHRRAPDPANHVARVVGERDLGRERRQPLPPRGDQRVHRAVCGDVEGVGVEQAAGDGDGFGRGREQQGDDWRHPAQVTHAAGSPFPPVNRGGPRSLADPPGDDGERARPERFRLQRGVISNVAVVNVS